MKHPLLHFTCKALNLPSLIVNPNKPQDSYVRHVKTSGSSELRRSWCQLCACCDGKFTVLVSRRMLLQSVQSALVGARNFSIHVCNAFFRVMVLKRCLAYYSLGKSDKAGDCLFSEECTSLMYNRKTLHIILRNLHEALSKWFMELSLNAVILA